MTDLPATQPVVSPARPTWVQISLPNLIHNYQTLKKYMQGQAGLMAIVKANAYGHGAIACAQALESSVQPDWFGVALVEEGVALRQAGIKAPILCLTGFGDAQVNDLLTYQLTPVVHRLEQAEALNAAAQERELLTNFHVKVDTGLGRLGVPWSEFATTVQVLKGFSNLRFDGLMTHFAEADADDSAYTNMQISQYLAARQIVQELGLTPQWHHLANSAGIHAHPTAWGNLARAGAAMYGFTRDVIAPHPPAFDVRPVLSWHSRIIHLKTVPAGTALGYGRAFRTTRTSRIATIPVGYADGLHRAHSNNGSVLVHGKRVAVVGRVSMDLTLLDVTDVPAAVIGDEVVLIGQQQDAKIQAEDLAAEIGTISYEIACHISARVPRHYIPL